MSTPPDENIDGLFAGNAEIPADITAIDALEHAAIAVSLDRPYEIYQYCAVQLGTNPDQPTGWLFLATQRSSADEKNFIDHPTTSVTLTGSSEEVLLEVSYGIHGELIEYSLGETATEANVLKLLESLLDEPTSSNLPLRDLGRMLTDTVTQVEEVGFIVSDNSGEEHWQHPTLSTSLISTIVRGSRSPLAIKRLLGHAFDPEHVLIIETENIIDIEAESSSVDPDENSHDEKDQHLSNSPTLMIRYEDRANNVYRVFIHRANGRYVLYRYNPLDDNAIMPPTDDLGIDYYENDGSRHPAADDVALLNEVILRLTNELAGTSSFEESLQALLEDYTE